MSRGQHAADDGSFGRSAGGAMARGVALIVVAVIIGILLLQATDGPDPFPAGTGPLGGDETTTTSTSAADNRTTTSSPPTTIDPSTITVLVANGASVAGLAGDLTDMVAEAGFETAAATDVDEDVEASTVYFTPGFEDAADAVAELFDPVPEVAPLPDPPPVDDLAGANVVVVAGPELAPE